MIRKHTLFKKVPFIFYYGQMYKCHACKHVQKQWGLWHSFYNSDIWGTQKGNEFYHLSSAFYGREQAGAVGCWHIPTIFMAFLVIRFKSRRPVVGLVDRGRKKSDRPPQHLFEHTVRAEIRLQMQSKYARNLSSKAERLNIVKHCSLRGAPLDNSNTCFIFRPLTNAF